MVKTLVLSVLSLAACGLCSASQLYVNATGTFSSTDTADTFVIPGDSFSLQFVVPNATTTNATNSTMLSFDVPVTNFTYKLNGSLVNVGQPSEITFYTAADGGGVEVDFGPSTEFLFSSSQIFAGATSSPTFAAGTFTSQSFLFLDSNNVDSNSATLTVSPTPEPSSILLMLCGVIGLFAVGIRKSARVC
jgi:hypothetical protein